ncbi:MAG: hypothetical protein M0Z69_05525 [Actinomycetota bacterium]|nr:hypothetical protein [Actinomycetota bacterium]
MAIRGSAAFEAFLHAASLEVVCGEKGCGQGAVDLGSGSELGTFHVVVLAASEPRGDCRDGTGGDGEVEGLA